MEENLSQQDMQNIQDAGDTFIDLNQGGAEHFESVEIENIDLVADERKNIEKVPEENPDGQKYDSNDPENKEVVIDDIITEEKLTDDEIKSIENASEQNLDGQGLQHDANEAESKEVVIDNTISEENLIAENGIDDANEAESKEVVIDNTISEENLIAENGIEKAYVDEVKQEHKIEENEPQEANQESIIPEPQANEQEKSSENIDEIIFNNNSTDEHSCGDHHHDDHSFEDQHHDDHSFDSHHHDSIEDHHHDHSDKDVTKEQPKIEPNENQDLTATQTDSKDSTTLVFEKALTILIKFAEDAESSIATFYKIVKNNETYRLITVYFVFGVIIWSIFSKNNTIVYKIKHETQSCESSLLKLLENHRNQLADIFSRKKTTPKQEPPHNYHISEILENLKALQQLEKDFQSQVADATKEVLGIIDKRRTPASPPQEITLTLPS